MAKRATHIEMKVIPRFVYNPEKADRALSAMADILAGAIQRSDTRKPGEKNSSSRF